MATIKVNSAVMREKASSFKTIATSVRNYTDDMLTEIEGLKAFWEGDAAEATVAEFKKQKAVFDEIIKTIENYGSFLDNAAAEYDKTEQANAGA